MPPQSSRAQSPTETTRTSSPYFSPNSAIAPGRPRLVLGHDLGAHVEVGGEHLVDLLLDVAQHRRRAPPTGEAKSNRNRPGAFSEPAWVAVSPSACAERLVHQVGGGVRPADRAAPVDVDLAGDRVADR